MFSPTDIPLFCVWLAVIGIFSRTLIGTDVAEVYCSHGLWQRCYKPSNLAVRPNCSLFDWQNEVKDSVAAGETTQQGGGGGEKKGVGREGGREGRERREKETGGRGRRERERQRETERETERDRQTDRLTD